MSTNGEKSRGDSINTTYGTAIDAMLHDKWKQQGRFRADITENPDTYYGLDMFPYPSGNGLHVGHVRGYVAGDVIARYNALKGKNVLRPMGWDAFGLPAEQYALKHGEHPDNITKRNIANFRKQLDSLGLAYDWSRELSTTDDDFMRWTQWAFLKMYESGLVYESNEPINWCPSCKTGLSNEDLEGCNCERCGTQVEQKPIPQIKIRIKDYAGKLIAGMEELEGWDPEILEMQRNWIGLEDGYAVRANLLAVSDDDQDEPIALYTSNLPGLLGSTYVTVAADSKMAQQLTVDSPQDLKDLLAAYVNMPEVQRKQQQAMLPIGRQVLNPISGEYVDVLIDPQLIADRVEAKFVTEYDKEWQRLSPESPMTRREIFEKYLIPEDINDDDIEAIVKFYFSALHLPAEPKQISNLQDWVFSRQRFWGEPIPLVHCATDGTVPLPEDALPLRLPQVETYSLTDTGESPLAGMEEWVNTVCPHCGGEATRETNTMPQWAGSSWYFDRYKDPHNNEMLVGETAEEYWGNVDLCIGGLEHATRHLIYARFWHRFLHEEGAVSTPEPFKSVRHVGLVLGADGRKMGKRYGNVVDPLEVVDKYGADVVRVYSMFMGDFAKETPWDDKGIKGVQRFLGRVWRMPEMIDTSITESKIKNESIREIESAVSDLKFNVAVARLMELSRTITAGGAASQEDVKTFLTVLAPFAPHMTEYIYDQMGLGDFREARWPNPGDEPIKAEVEKEPEGETREYVIMINGKKVVIKELPIELGDTNSDEGIAALIELAGVSNRIGGKTIRKVIVPEGRNLINIVAQ
jgi:leucyl-tRNA synthetase